MNNCAKEHIDTQEEAKGIAIVSECISNEIELIKAESILRMNLKHYKPEVLITGITA